MDPSFQAGRWVPVTCFTHPAALLLAKPQHSGDKRLLNPADGNSQSSAFKQNETKRTLNSALEGMCSSALVPVPVRPCDTCPEEETVFEIPVQNNYELDLKV